MLEPEIQVIGRKLRFGRFSTEILSTYKILNLNGCKKIDFELMMSCSVF